MPTTCLVDVRSSQGSIRMPRTSSRYNKNVRDIISRIPMRLYNVGILKNMPGGTYAEKVIGKQFSMENLGK